MTDADNEGDITLNEQLSSVSPTIKVDKASNNNHTHKMEAEAGFTVEATTTDTAGVFSKAEDHDTVAKYLLNGKFFLTALEFHAELTEFGKELPRLKDFFSNPANFESQMRLDTLLSLKKTASVMTLDSIDDFSRFSDDGNREHDEKIAVLEFELRKAKETIQELRQNITEMTAEKKSEGDNNADQLSVEEAEGNQYEFRTINFLINNYLLKRNYKLTSITFTEEVADQDLDDWDDVGLNMSQPPDILLLLRDFSKHKVEPINDEILKLNKEIDKLNIYSNKLEADMKKQTLENKQFLQQIHELKEERSKLKTQFDEMSSINQSAVFVSDIVERQVTPTPSNSSDMVAIDFEKPKHSRSSESSRTSDETEMIHDDIKTIDIDTSNEIHSTVSNSNNIDSKKDSNIENEDRDINKSNSEYNDNDDIDETDHIERDKTCIQNDIDNSKFENKKYESSVCSRETSLSFVETLFSLVHSQNDSRLAQEVLKGLDQSPVEVIANALPNIIPNVLLNKREELIPLILCAVLLHKDANTRDQLLNSLFNLIKKPSKEQRLIILNGCVVFARKVDSSRIEAELLPQIWVQIDHKFAERRILVAETCGFISPYVPVELRSSLIFSMLSQMLQQDRNKDVRMSVIKSLALNLTYVSDERKYYQAFGLMKMGLEDDEDDIVLETKNFLLPIFAVWSSEISKFQEHLLQEFVDTCTKALKDWFESSIVNSAVGESTTTILLSEMIFNNYIDCMIRIVTIMFVDCLNTAPFSQEYDDTREEVPIAENRLPAMKNKLSDVDIIYGDANKMNFLVNKFDKYWEKPDNKSWKTILWISQHCLPAICDMSEILLNNQVFIDKVICYALTISKIFGKTFTSSKIIPYFEKRLRDTGESKLNDAPPLSTPLLPVFLCGVLTAHREEELEKRLFTFIKQCLLTIATQRLSNESLLLALTLLCENVCYQSGLLHMLRETLVYPVAEVRKITAVVLEGLVGVISKDLLSSHLAPAIITASNDRDIVVRIASVPALGKVAEGLADKSLLERVSAQFQTLCEDEELQSVLNLHKVIVRTFSNILMNVETKFREDFILPRLKRITESNCNREEADDRLEIVEELIRAFTTALQCFLSKETISSLVIPSLKLMESDIRNVSPETSDSIVLLLKDAEEKTADDKVSIGSGTTAKGIFGGISSRFKKRPKE